MLLSSNPEIVVSDCWSPQGWNLNFRRHLNDWEVERVVDLLKEVDTFGGTIMEPDRLRWRHSSEGSFTVNKLYKREHSIMQQEELKIWRNVWKNIAPTKVKCFTWLVVRKACLTHEVLQKKGRVVVTRCFFVQ
uniref:Putative ovule protein n=1 Tax=Solanum chacoense TaxID=4108 RepID=A0A0V0I3T7_SOLCH